MNSFVGIFSSRRMFVVLLLGISSGLPLALTGATLQAWMTEEGVDLKLISVFALVGVPYTCKFLWSPLMDRVVPSVLGRRRGWMLGTQICLILAILAISVSKPSEHPFLLACFALCLAFFSASQDIVIDAYRAEILHKEELGAGAGVAILGYRLGMLLSGALAMILADIFSWSQVYMIMAAAVGIGMLAVFIAPEPEVSENVPQTIKEAVIAPLLDYFKRKGAFEIVAFILLYKLGEVMAVSLTTPFLLSLGFSKTEIGAVSKLFGLIATISGSIIGGGLMAKLGMMRSLFMFGILQAISPICFAALSMIGQNTIAMGIAICSENFFVGLSTAPFIAFLMSLCNKRFTATQYALLSSLAALCRVFAATPTGYLVQQLGWTNFFGICVFASVPGLLMLFLRAKKWEGDF